MQKIIAKISIPALLHNASVFAKKTGVPLCAVVKADAYGHGAERIVSALQGQVSLFAVATIEEGLTIQVASGQTPILVFTPPTSDEEGKIFCDSWLVATVDSLSQLAFFPSPKGVRVHIKVNTGMNRYGIEVNQLESLCKRCKRLGVQVEGIYSHLYSKSGKETRKQARQFNLAVEICKRYFPDVIAHLSATYGSKYGKKYAYDMVRIGLGLYGYAPFRGGKKLSLKPVMKVYAKTLRTREFTSGGIGYGKRRKVKKGTPFSLVRYGYADGLFRKKTQPLAGKRCMDVSFYWGKAEETVCIMDDATVLAKGYRTIPYEILCMVSRRAEFVYE